MRGHGSQRLRSDVARLFGVSGPRAPVALRWHGPGVGGYPLAGPSRTGVQLTGVQLPLAIRAPRRYFSAPATASADQLQALAHRLIDDRALAERLAASAEAPKLLHSASSGSGEEGAEKRKESEEGWSTAERVYGRLVTDTPMPTQRQMKIYSMQHFVPFVGFGFCDNFIMILAGDFIDAKLGIAFGITTMAAAGIGNTLSDVCGLWLSGVIETAGAAMGLPRSGLTIEQRSDVRMIMLRNTSMISGMVLGCIIGMVPLLYPEEWRMWESRHTLEMKQHEHDDEETKEEVTKYQQD